MLFLSLRYGADLFEFEKNAFRQCPIVKNVPCKVPSMEEYIVFDLLNFFNYNTFMCLYACILEPMYLHAKNIQKAKNHPINVFGSGVSKKIVFFYFPSIFHMEKQNM